MRTTKKWKNSLSIMPFLIVNIGIVCAFVGAYTWLIEGSHKADIDEFYNTAVTLRKKELESSINLITNQVYLYRTNILNQLDNELTSIKYSIKFEFLNHSREETKVDETLKIFSAAYPEYEFTKWDLDTNEIKTAYHQGETIHIPDAIEEYVDKAWPHERFHLTDTNELIAIKLTHSEGLRIIKYLQKYLKSLVDEVGMDLSLVELDQTKKEEEKGYFKTFIFSSHVDNLSFEMTDYPISIQDMIIQLKHALIKEGEFFHTHNKGKKDAMLVYGMVYKEYNWAVVATLPVDYLMDGTIESVYDYDQNMKARLIYALILTLIVIISAFLSGMLLIRRHKTKEMIAEKEQAQLVLKHNEIILSKYERINEIVHDIKNHLFSIKGLINSNDPQNALDYIDELYDDFVPLSQTVITGNQLIDVILNDKMLWMKKEGIEFTRQIENVSLDFMKDKHLTILLTNLFDNAIESCQRSREKHIDFQIYTFNQSYVVLKLTNSCPLPPTVEKHRLLSQKRNSEGHGYGVKNIERVAQLYNGMTMWEYDEREKTFQYVITMPLPEESFI